jgi:hypothetical protein
VHPEMSIRRLIIIAATLAAVTGAGLYVEKHYACGCAVPKPEPAKWPVLSGAPVVGSTVNTTNGIWVRSGAHARYLATGFAVRWKVCTSATDLGGCSNATGTGNHCANSSGGCPYIVAAADSGGYLRSFVTATGAGGSTTQYSLPSAQITSGVLPVNSVAPKISGIPMPHASGIPGAADLSVTTGAWTNRPTSYAYQWQDCNATGANCSNAAGAGATSHKYTVVPADTASSIRVRITAHNSSGGSTPVYVYTGPAPAFWYAGGHIGTARQDANLFRMINLNPAYADLIDSYHAANPNVITLGYVDSTISSTGNSSGNSCADANAAWTQASAHPGNPRYDWFLYNNNGFGSRNRLSGFFGEPGSDAMDIGNTYWQTACANFDASRASTWHLRRGDGFFLDDVSLYWDDVTGFPGWSTCCASANGGITSDAGIDDAYLREMKAREAIYRSNGYVAIGNIDFGRLGGRYATARNNIASELDGSMNEGFPWAAVAADAQWVYTIDEGIYNETHGKWFIADATAPHAQSQTEAGATYSLASFLMEANGRSVFDLDGIGAPSTWYPEFTAAMQLGPALTAAALASYRRTDSNGHNFYERDFTNGIVVVNPSENAVASFTPNPGGTYSGRVCYGIGDRCSMLRNSSTVSLPGGSGHGDSAAILLRTG